MQVHRLGLHETSQQDHSSESSCQAHLYKGDTFHQFSKLPIELRERVWQHTWPGPRLIEVGSHDSVEATSEDNDERSFFLRILGQFFVKHFIHTEQEEIPQHWFSPVTLFVCHESRQHTLRRYRLIEHPEFIYESFYCDPSIDILWFNHEFTGEAVNHPHIDVQERMDKLYQGYGAQLNFFQTVLVDEIFWNPESGNQEYLARLLGLETILIMDTSRQDDTREDVAPIVHDAEDFAFFAAAAKKEYAKFKEQHPDWLLKSIEYVARDASSSGFVPNSYPKVARRYPLTSS